MNEWYWIIMEYYVEWRNMSCFKLLLLQFSGEFGENYKPQQTWLFVSLPRFKPHAFRIKIEADRLAFFVDLGFSF